jgi:hypothetical protein
MQIRFPLPLAFCAAVLTGCVSSRAINYSGEARPPKPASYVMEILESSKLTRPYRVIGIVQVNAGAKLNTRDPIRVLRDEARAMGGDALVDLSQQPVGAGMMSGGTAIYSGHARDLWTAKVIVWTDAKPN